MPRHAERRRRRGAARWRAVLAGGLVLGAGATATLAAWTDTEVATGDFGSSVFDVQSQSAGSPTYADNLAAPGASLTFTASAMSPGVSHYAWLNVRTTPASTVGGDIVLTGLDRSGGLETALEYRAVRTSSPNPGIACTAAAFAAPSTFIVGGTTTWVPLSNAPPAGVSNPIGAAGASIGFCFDVRVMAGAANSFQGQSASATWTFTGTSG
ncbi:SipW-dependent-type signal peptide-containing protein [Agromyces albus]|uniref:SipW-dependent-type signal peptide-containing protein n=1 Tax=Agromyces albus TaxID=205332 RepID=UPI002781B69A|nr:SipW-dependent-type signal peptide-containing protein [Agromyces albus]MDQ0574513.1 putative ribosomally synthesized peptide with SipW-like signal peptide [Agromyces albus]